MEVEMMDSDPLSEKPVHSFLLPRSPEKPGFLTSRLQLFFFFF